MSIVKFEINTDRPEDFEAVARMAFACHAALTDGDELIPTVESNINAPDDLADVKWDQVTGENITEIPSPSEIKLDTKDGIPWDARIHSGNKTINKDGGWKKKKGISDDIYNSVVAELKAVMSIPLTGQMPNNMPQGSQMPNNIPQGGQMPNNIPQGGQMPNNIPQGGQMPNNMQANIPDPEMTFVGVIRAVNDLVNAGRFTMTQFTEVLSAQGIPSAPLLANREDLLPIVWQAVKQAVSYG